MKHPNLKSFLKATSEPARGIPTKSAFHGSGIHEVESAKNGVAHCRVSGRELLGEVGGSGLSAAATFGIGERLPAGMFPIAPSYLGGRLELMAQQYEQHTVHKMVVLYEPVVPATQPGALAMYFTNDVGEVTYFTGESELGHAATHDSFVQTTVWNETEMNINPSDAINKYFDEDHNESRLSVQGLVEILAADDITLDPTGATGPASLGNLYLVYDIEFFAAALANDVTLRTRATLTLTANAAPSVSSGEVIRLTPTTSVGSLAYAFDNYPPGAGSGTLVGWAFYGTVTDPLLSAVPPATLTWITNEVSDGVYLARGQGFWIDFMHNWNGGSSPVVNGIMHTDLNGMEESYSTSGLNGSALMYSAGAAGVPGANAVMVIEGYFVKKSEDA